MNNLTTEELLNQLTGYADEIRKNWSDLAVSDGGSVFYFLSSWIIGMRDAIASELPTAVSREAKDPNE